MWLDTVPYTKTKVGLKLMFVNLHFCRAIFISINFKSLICKFSIIFFINKHFVKKC
jgi:hypothetical protein